MYICVWAYACQTLSLYVDGIVHLFQHIYKTNIAETALLHEMQGRGTDDWTSKCIDMVYRLVDATYIDGGAPIK
jgi:hypothetical protein